MDPSCIARAARRFWRGTKRMHEDDPAPLIIFSIGFCLLIAVGIASSKPAIFVIAGVLAVAYAWRLTELGQSLEDHDNSSAG